MASLSAFHLEVVVWDGNLVKSCIVLSNLCLSGIFRGGVVALGQGDAPICSREITDFLRFINAVSTNNYYFTSICKDCNH